MIDVTVKIIEYTEKKSSLVDEHPVVNDKDYAEVVTVPPSVSFRYVGKNTGTHSITGSVDDTYDDLITKVMDNVTWNTWYYEMDGQGKSFSELGLDVPRVYDYESGECVSVDSVGDFIDNCRGLVDRDFYDSVKWELFKIAVDNVFVRVR